MTARDINGDPLEVGNVVVCGNGGHYTLKKMRIKSITDRNVSLVELDGREFSRCIRPHNHVVLAKDQL